MQVETPASAGVPVFPMRDPWGARVEVSRPGRAEVLMGRGWTMEPRPYVPQPSPEPVSVSVAVAHAPWSEARARNLRGYGFSYALVTDDDRQGCWPTVRRAWEAARPTATHHLVLTDDLTLPAGFRAAVNQCVSLFPHSPISFLSVQPGARLTCEAGLRWCVSWGVTGAATVLPVAMVREFLAWERENIRPDCPHDDVRISAYLNVRGLGALTPVPCLVEHGDLPSILPDIPGQHHGRAAVFLPDVRGIDWADSADAPVFIGISVDRPDGWFTDGRTLEEARA